MKKTAQFGLNQWEMSDRIQMQDFNRDNAAIEAALAARNCQFYTASYVGTGDGPRSFTFPHKPMVVFVMTAGGIFMVGVQGVPNLLMNYLTNGFSVDVAWEGNTVTWQHYSGGADYSANCKGKNYTLLALLDADI